jgi:hypothetical protein
VSADYNADRVGVVAQHLMVGPDADPQMGFVTRRDIRRTDVSARYTVRPAAFGLRKVDVFIEGQHIVRTTGEKQDVGAGPVMNLEWNSGDSIGAFYFQGSTRLDEPFDLDDRVTVPRGDYTVRHLSFSARSASRRPFVGTAEANVEDVYGGRIASLGGTLRAAPGSHLTLGLGFTRNRVDLPGGAFTADIGSVRATYAFSTRLFVSAFVQHNRLDRRLLANFRLDFIHRPGSDLFLVFNEERGDGASLHHVARRGGAVKLTWLTRF